MKIDLPARGEITITHPHCKIRSTRPYDRVPMIMSSNGLISTTCLFIEEYPHLYISDNNGRGNIFTIYKRYVYPLDGYTWSGTARDREWFVDIPRDDATLHIQLEHLETIAKEASQEGFFFCATCRTPQNELAGTNFNSHFCKTCYESNPKAKVAVDEARRPGYYD